MNYDDDFYQSIVEQGATLIWVSGLDKGCYYFNETWLRFRGRSLEQEYGNGWAEGVHDADFERCLSIYTSAFDQKRAFSMAYRLKRYDGRFRWIQDDGIPKFDDQGVFKGFIGYCLDIHELKMAEIRLREHNRLLAMISSGQSLDTTMQCFMNYLHSMFDGYQFSINYVFPESQSPQISQGQLVLPILDSGGKFLASLGVSISDDCEKDTRFETEISDELNFVALIIEKIRADQVLKLQQQSLQQMAHTDALTKLPNRASLLTQLRMKMALCHRENRHLAVAFIDLDGFKAVNDQYDHATGDELLVSLTKRMKSQLRQNDELARLGGDEFVLLIPDLEKPDDFVPVIKRLLACISEPVNLTVGTLQLSASIGITWYPQAETTAEKLIQQADQAMYRAKHNGRNQYQIFDDSIMETLAHSVDVL